MPPDDTKSTPDPLRRAHSILELLHDAAPPQPTGRVRTLNEARAALKLPTSAAPKVMQAMGIPPDFWLRAYQVSDSENPDRVAEFAVLRVLTRERGRLIPRPKGRRLHLREKSNALWVVWGSIVLSSHNSLVIETLNIGPAFTGQLSQRDDELARGISAEFTRLLSLPELLSKTVEKLQADGYLLELGATQGARPVSQKQREFLNRLAQANKPRTLVSEDELIALSQRYIVLCQRGLRYPNPQLASEFGLTRVQVRDRIRKARQHQYLGPGTKGRATATIGPALIKLGWTPPLTPTDPSKPLVANQENTKSRSESTKTASLNPFPAAKTATTKRRTRRDSRADDRAG
jgi:hypothetical protein